MSESYLFATNKALNQDTVVWTNQISAVNSLNFSNASLTESLNETYATAIDGNDTEYLSVLETTNEVTLEDLNNLTLGNSKDERSNVEMDNEHSDEVSDVNVGENGEQVVVFSIEGSDDLYGIQIVQDEHGNSQKYQFKFRQTEEGQLEAIPETIHLISNEDESSEQEQEFFQVEEMVVHNTQEFEQNESDETESVQETAESIQVFIKGEPNEQYSHQADEEGIRPPDLELAQEELDLKPDLHQTVANVKSEQHEEIHNEVEIYHQDDGENHLVYGNESDQVIYNQEEIFDHEEAGNEIYCQEDENRDDTDVDQTEETQVQEDANFYEENVGSEQNYETLQFPNNQMVLETQYIPEVANEDTDTDEEYPQYERVYVQHHDGQILDEDEGSELAETERETVTNDEYNHTDVAENGNFRIVERVHVTAEEQILETSYQDSPLADTAPNTILKQPIQNVNSNILKQQSVLNAAKVPKKSKKVLCYIVQHPEKENVNAIPTMVPKNYKANPRSVLKQSAIDISLSSAKIQQLAEKAKLEKRFAKNKDAIQAKLFNNFLSKTTIPHAPVRQKRLPRKQEIKPVDARTEEEIIVQEVMVSSKGFIESVEDRLKGKDKLEIVGYIDLSDSEDENVKSNQKKSTAKTDGVIEILSSEEESELPESSNKHAATPKKRRGRPRKNTENGLSPEKVDDNDTPNEEARDSADESSPTKKNRTETEGEVTTENHKEEFNCPLCSKSFPSPNSLSTHIQHHNLENRMRKSRPSTFEFKHKCLECETTFKNAILLNRHVCPKTVKPTTTLHHCNVCKRTFDSSISLNLHKKTHETNGSTFVRPSGVARPSNVAKRLTLDSRKSVVGTNRESENDSKAQNGAIARKPFSRNSVLPRSKPLIPLEELDGTCKYKCEKCNQCFKNGILLQKHVCAEEKTKMYKCSVCGLTFRDIAIYNFHKKKHIKENLIRTTSEVKISPMKYLTSGKRTTKNSPRKSFGRRSVVNKGSPSFKVLQKFSCSYCNVKFTSKVLLDIHIRKQCVKNSTSRNSTARRLSLGANSGAQKPTKILNKPLDMHAQCEHCPKNFRSYKTLLMHQVTDHGYSEPAKEEPVKPKKKTLVQTREHTGIPANPRLQRAFAEMMTKLQSLTPRKVDCKPDDL